VSVLVGRCSASSVVRVGGGRQVSHVMFSVMTGGGGLQALPWVESSAPKAVKSAPSTCAEHDYAKTVLVFVAVWLSGVA